MKNTPKYQDWISRVHLAAAGAALVFTAALLAVITAQPAQAQTFTELYEFCSESGCPDGSEPNGALVQGIDGNLYGSTNSGGDADLCDDIGCGTLFKITTTGTLTTLFDFAVVNGAAPQTLIQGTDGNFYGTTIAGGADNLGTVFGTTAGGRLITLHTFTGTDGELPYGGLVQGTDGKFYGTTNSGGANCMLNGFCGTVFRITPGGKLATLYTFCTQNENCPDGSSPRGQLIQATDGNFYGTTSFGGPACNLGEFTNCGGTVFKITLGGTLTTLYNFCSGPTCPDGSYPAAGLVQASDGNFYGTASIGGNPSLAFGTGCGTVFQITPSGTLTTLYSFCSQPNSADGATPSGGLIQGTDGNLYGTTDVGGAYSDYPGGCCGTIFQITTGGQQRVLYSFSGPDGSYPGTGVVQDTDGNFYGTTQQGGTYPDCSCGTVFSLNNFLSPFVKTLPTSGAVGTVVKILGTDLTGATSVTFNGEAATFTVASGGTYITTTVPAGATTGFVTVVTPSSSSGTLTSNLPFVVPLLATSTVVTSSLNPSTFGESLTFTATVSASGTPTGEVTFLNGNVKLGTATLTGGMANLTTTTLNAGTESITAVYGGSSAFASSTSPVLSQVVQKATSKVTLTSSENPSNFGDPVTFTASVAPEFGGTPSGTVTFRDGTTTLGSVKLTSGVAAYTTSSLSSGAHKITATYNSNANFDPSSAGLTQTVN